MKKLTWLAIAILSLSSITVLAATSAFTDKGSFAAWFAPSVEKMQYNEIISGYPDGSFKPENNVNRAELAVILDQYATATGNELQSKPLACTQQFVYGLTIHLQNQYGNTVTGATIVADQNGEESAFEESDGVYSGLGEAEAGYYTVKITKDGYYTHIETVKMDHTGCHVINQQKTITLIGFVQ